MVATLFQRLACNGFASTGTLRALVVCFGMLVTTTSAVAYVPLLDEVEGIPGNNKGHYLVLPAWENLDPSTRQKAYFIIPKYLVIGGNVDAGQPEYQFGVSHRGYTLFAGGTADYPPTIDLLATVQLYQDDADIKAIQGELTKRDLAAGFSKPVFPEAVFEKFEGSVVVAGVASSFKLTDVKGGYPGQLTLVKAYLPGDALPSLIVDMPSGAGRDAALWGVVLIGKIPGYGNRLKCTITMHHKKIYEHFKARASAQAYWGLVKADVGKEVKTMDKVDTIDFGLCRGSADQIDKIVMPVWDKIIKLEDDDGNKMFQEMVKSSNAVPGHPEAGGAGWGFQVSAGWESVSYNAHTTISFDVSYRTTWDLPLGMTFSTACNKWKQYFINTTDRSKPCVDPADFPRVRDASRECFKRYLTDIAQYPADIQKGARARLRTMSCAWDGSWELEGVSLAVSSIAPTQVADALRQRACRSQFIKLADRWHSTGAMDAELFNAIANDISIHGCAWDGGSNLLRLRRPEALQELGAAKKIIGN